MGFLGDIASGIGNTVGGLLGVGNKGMNYQAGQASLIDPFTQAQVKQADSYTMNGLDQQQAFLNALQAQNGIGNQGNVYNQLAGVANGTGANPALALLNNSTGQNVANQAALMAGQRGANANVGLMARQAGMQGANLQQQAIGQGAALQAQQQLQALAQMGGLANNQVAQQGSALGGLNQYAQGNQQNMLGALANYNNATTGSQGSVNNANSSIANTTAKGQQDLIGGAIKGVGLAFASEGGLVKGYADGGTVQGPQSYVGKFMSGFLDPAADSRALMGQQTTQTMGNNNSAMYGGGQSIGKALGGLFGGGSSAPMASGSAGMGDIGLMMGAEGGPVVPGQAKVAGNSLKNDTVPAMLSPHEIVLPRSVTMAANAPEKAAAFVAAILKQRGMGK